MNRTGALNSKLDSSLKCPYLGAFEAVIGTFAVAAIASGVAGRTRRIVGSVVIGSAFGTTGADVTRIALTLAVSSSTPASLQ